LYIIFESLEKIIESFQPDVVAIENIFVAKNVRSSLILGHARGSAIVAATRANLDVMEYTPSQVKKAVAGTGGATKDQIQQMVKIVLNMPEVACEDASDALAVAICHLNCSSFEEKIKASEGAK
jgi:crossover junction endodeoxyribonuclease RuvC